MLARIQKFIILAALLAPLGWTALTWGASPRLAITGLCVWLLFPPLVLGLEFLAARKLHRGDPAPAPGGLQLARAWLAECVCVVRVFCWRQPFRSGHIPDHLPGNGQRGVVFIHGYVCNRGLWTPWLALLRRQDRAFIAVNLEPVFGSIDDYAPLIDQAVLRITAATGKPPVLVCHSMGGLAARAWLREAGDDSRVERVVTIGTPHHGTWLGRFAHTPNSRQMKLASRWLQQLERDEPPARRARFTCWYSNCDNIVFPPSTAALPGAANHLVTGQAHVALAFEPALMKATLAQVAGL